MIELSGALAVWSRNFLVWRKLVGASMVANFGDPLLYMLGLGYGLGLYIGKIDGVPYMAFLASGILCSSAMNTATFEGLYSVFTRMEHQHTWEGMMTAPLSVGDVLAGELFWAATKSLISGVAILIVAAALGGVLSWSTFWLALPVLFLTGLCFGALALIVCMKARGYDFFAYYFTIFVTPMFLFCGVFYPLTALPASLQIVAEILPLTHAVGLIRPLLTGMPLVHPFLSLFVLLAYSVGGYLIALKLAKKRLLQ